jgi:hypothetical protein
VEATIWGMPAVSMAALRQSLRRDLDADVGDVVYFSNVMEPRHEFLTANYQMPYVFTVFDLRRGPVVLDVPAASNKVALFGSGIDSWEVPLVDVGPTGEDGGEGGRYVFLPPDFAGVPPDGVIVVPSPTSFVHICLRPITIGAGTLEASVASPLVIEAAHGQVDGCSRHPARLVGRHEDRHVSHLLERHEPSRVGPACEELLPLFPGHARCLGARLEGVLDRACLRHALWSQTDHANALRCELGG